MATEVVETLADAGGASDAATVRGLVITNTATAQDMTYQVAGHNFLAIPGVATTGPNQILLALFGQVHTSNGHGEITGVTDDSGQGLTWHKAISNNSNGVNSPNAEIWWALCPTQAAGVTVTATYDGNLWNARGAVLSIEGANTSNPIGATGYDGGTHYPNGTARGTVRVGPIQAANSRVFAALGIYTATTTLEANTEQVYGASPASRLVKATALTALGDVGGTISIGVTTVPDYARYVGVEVLAAGSGTQYVESRGDSAAGSDAGTTQQASVETRADAGAGSDAVSEVFTPAGGTVYDETGRADTASAGDSSPTQAVRASEARADSAAGLDQLTAQRLSAVESRSDAAAASDARADSAIRVESRGDASTGGDSSAGPVRRGELRGDTAVVVDSEVEHGYWIEVCGDSAAGLDVGSDSIHSQFNHYQENLVDAVVVSDAVTARVVTSLVLGDAAATYDGTTDNIPFDPHWTSWPPSGFPRSSETRKRAGGRWWGGWI